MKRRKRKKEKKKCMLTMKIDKNESVNVGKFSKRKWEESMIMGKRIKEKIGKGKRTNHNDRKYEMIRKVENGKV